MVSPAVVCTGHGLSDVDVLAILGPDNYIVYEMPAF